MGRSYFCRSRVRGAVFGLADNDGDRVFKKDMNDLSGFPSDDGVAVLDGFMPTLREEAV